MRLSDTSAVVSCLCVPVSLVEQDGGGTPLMLAVQSDYRPVVAALLAQGADPNTPKVRVLVWLCVCVRVACVCVCACVLCG